MRHQLSVLTIVVLCVGLVADIRADEADDSGIDFESIEEDRENDGRRLQITERTNRRISKAMECNEEDDFEGAKRELEKLSFRRMNPRERALVARLLGSSYFSLGNTEGAIFYFRKAVEQEALPLEDENSLRFNIAQIQISAEEWTAAIATLREWFVWERDPNPLGYYLLAIAHHNLGQHDLAVANAVRAVELAEEPREPWLQLAVALHAGQENYDEARPYLETLIVLFPKKRYWVQLSLIYGAVDSFHESLSVQQLAYAQGLLVEDRELQRLARSYLYHEMPYQAAKVLSKGFEDGAIPSDDIEALELLGNSWISAREYERALEPLTQAADLSANGALYVRLSQVLVQREQWDDAAGLLEKALDKGGLENEGKAKLLLGTALYNDGQVVRARRWFEQASKHDSTQNNGRAWVAHIDREMAGSTPVATAAATATPAS